MDMQSEFTFGLEANDAPWLGLALGALVAYLLWWCHACEAKGQSDDALLPNDTPLSEGSLKLSRRRPCCPCFTLFGCCTFTPLVILAMGTDLNVGVGFAGNVNGRRS